MKHSTCKRCNAPAKVVVFQIADTDEYIATDDCGYGLCKRCLRGRDEPEVSGLIAVGEIPPAERAKLDIGDFFGHEEDIKAFKEDHKAAAKMVVNREWPELEWNGVSSLRMAQVERLRYRCKVEKGLALLEMKSRKLEAAKKVLQNHRANGGLPKSVVEEAEALLIAASESGANKEGLVDAD